MNHKETNKPNRLNFFGWFGSTKTATKPPAHLKMGVELVAETSQNLHILTRLSAWESFIEFCRRENFRT